MTKKKATKHSREEFQKKQVRHQKSIRGQPETDYGELKKIASYSLTPTGIESFKNMSRNLQISASELLERIARGRYQLVTPELSQALEEYDNPRPD